MKKLQTTNLFAILFMIVFAVVFAILFSRLMYIQASGEVDGVDLNRWAEKQRTASYTLPAERGQILDRSGMVLADNRPSYNLYAVIDEDYSQNSDEPLHVKNPDKTANKLAPVLDMEARRIMELIQNGKEKGLFQIEFGSNGEELTEKQKEEIEALDLPGIYFQENQKRYYPNDKFASHVIGFTQKEEQEKLKGAMGIEKSMNDQLMGEDGHISYEQDQYANKLLDPNEVLTQPKDGSNVYLTLDQKIQTFLEDAMSDINEQYKPKQMMAIVMNPKTGEVLAMSNRPTFNPNTRNNIDNWYNDIISYPFAPGSTMKIFTVGAAMDAGVYNGNEKYQSGSYKFMDGVRPVNDHNWGEGWGKITYDEGIRRSSNVAVSKLVWEKLGTEKFLEYLKRFDFDKKTGIDLSGEVAGEITYKWPSDKVRTAFGQSTTVTPIQLMKAATSVANDGKMMKPYVISKITDKNQDKVLKETKPEVVGEPIKKETAKRVRDILETVITGENGTGADYRLDDYSVAGKTGTAQLPDPENGGFLTGRENYIFSFLGMAPKDDPELMMYVAIKQPELENTEAGSEPVSYIFKSVMENSLHYLDISPDKKTEEMTVDPIKLSDYKGQSVESVKQTLTDQNVQVKVVGNGDKVKETIPQAGENILPESDIMILTNGDAQMPDLTGWSLREVLKFASFYDLKVEQMGNGYVTKQSTEPGTKVKEGSYLSVKLKPPNDGENEEPESENDGESQEDNENEEEAQEETG
ncbi:penicillin-binding protein 2B [Salinibacillus kushneri]|uniref:serine-type D-Ala-D-Ala carboxypeptidase n=1 Tax=Salinibacillus kushneri TaxID=237682 RepID=A0A1I0HP30_9BACI|nr:penicillin-binding protein [Salinibacillus kushneri]SET85523.1 penicillin-binding protein 2B [Salinibacillus kushneri]